MALTKEMIWKAADELDADGTKPTLANVRKRLGGVGSFTTIQEAMSEWKNRKQQEAQPLIDPPPAALAQLLENFGADIWNLARVAADQALDGKRRVIEENAAQIREQAIALAGSMDAELNELRAKIASLEETAALYRELQAKYHALEERAELELKHQKEHSAQEIHRAVTRANEKDSEAIEARKNERQALDRAARAEGQVEALEKQLGLAKKGK